MCIKDRVLEEDYEQLQFPFMFDVNMQLYRDYVLQDFQKWRTYHSFENVPQDVSFQVYAESLNHQGFGTRWQNKFFMENDLIVPYDDYYRRLIREDNT